VVQLDLPVLEHQDVRLNLVVQAGHVVHAVQGVHEARLGMYIVEDLFS